jgi:imidazolonepropionase-like amidohydrolase
MFIKGVRRVIDARFDSIAHMTVDASYGPDEARNMAKNGTAVVPTLSVGCYLAMNCGAHGNPEHPDYKFFEDMLNSYVPSQIERCTVPEVRHTYTAFREWLNREMTERKMPAVGTVYPDRVHGFAKHVRESFRNFQEAGATVGVGTDGGTGITFIGQLEVEFEAYKRFGYSPAQTLRMATLGNMEILKLDSELGSIEPGKYADLVLLGQNPLEDAQAIQHVRMVMKNGRVYHEAPGMKN